MNLNDHLALITGITPEIMIVLLGILLYYFQYYLKEDKFLLTNIIVTSFVLAIFDVYLKKILLFSVDNDYYKFVVNNVITIVVINFLIYFVKSSSEPRSILFYFNFGFACLFYETIVFKLYNYNGLCNQRLRSVTKTIMRLATIHVLSNFLNGGNYDKTWFDMSFSQIFNFALFDTVFSE